MGVAFLQLVPDRDDALAEPPELDVGGLGGKLAGSQIVQRGARLRRHLHRQHAANVEMVLRIKRRLLAQPLVIVEEKRCIALQDVRNDRLVVAVGIYLEGLRVALETVAEKTLQRGDVLLDGAGTLGVAAGEVEAIAESQLFRRDTAEADQLVEIGARGLRALCRNGGRRSPNPAPLPVGATRISLSIPISTAFAVTGASSCVSKFWWNRVESCGRASDAKSFTFWTYSMRWANVVQIATR